MAQRFTSKSDQPRVTDASLKKDSGMPKLEYRNNSGSKNLSRSPKTRNLGRAIRG